MSDDPRSQALAARILVVDDIEANVLLLQNLLRQQGFSSVEGTTDSRTVAALHGAAPFDLILLDLQMPYLDGLAVMDQLRPAAGEDFLPVIVVSAFSDEENRLSALRKGARDYILKPFAAPEVIQRVRNYLEVRILYRERARQAELLETRVREQVAQLERLSRMKRFFSPRLAERILAGGLDDPLKTHRREIAAVSIDLRGFTAFTESAEPEEVIELLRQYHGAVGPLILAHEGTIEYFSGDGIMVLFNDPAEVPNPAASAVQMADGMCTAFGEVAGNWRARGFELGIGIGIAQGYATIGTIGFEGRWDYAAVGSVTNRAARLCAEAQPGQILVDRKVQYASREQFDIEAVGELRLKGIAQPVPAFSVRGRHVALVA